MLSFFVLRRSILGCLPVLNYANNALILSTVALLFHLLHDLDKAVSFSYCRVVLFNGFKIEVKAATDTTVGVKGWQDF